ncbi:hypothetical protein FQN55_001520 [Onygenales sp. PD_40]|nr:hypothetical protein FQN55_001520 [Onygenales sp. PD_40]
MDVGTKHPPEERKMWADHPGAPDMSNDNEVITFLRERIVHLMKPHRPAIMGSQQYYPEHFGINNIPFGVGSSPSISPPQCVSRVGNTVIFLSLLAKAGLFADSGPLLEEAFSEPTLNKFAALPKEIHRHVRSVVQNALLTGCPLPEGSTADISDVQLHLPVAVGEFTDFSASKEHVLNAGEVVTGKRALPPAFLDFPIAYAGRASSIVVSGTPIERPMGQFLNRQSTVPEVVYGPSRQVDFELEVAAIIGQSVDGGQRVTATDADEHIFGLVLLNDWSARDIQAYEMSPLGPFNGKNFGTTISPWVITLAALEPFTVPAPAREKPVASYLHGGLDKAFSIILKADVRGGEMAYTTVCESNMGMMYWTFSHMLAHHTVGGCSLRTGDILASGTVSGSGNGEFGCLLESTWGGTKPISLADGTARAFLEDGDEVRFTGQADAGVGFGECVGRLVPARSFGSV